MQKPGELHRVFELDLRSLAIARIALGFLVFLDCIFRLQNFHAHYSEFGVMPLQILQSLYTPRGPCIHCWNSSDSWLYLVFALHMSAALLMMIGWKSRWSILATWLFTVSIQYRNPLIIDGGDVLLRCFLLWMFFLPTGEFFSLDARNKKGESTQTTWWLNSMLPIQLFLLYFCSALLKTGEDWWPLGTATGYALSLEAFVTPLGKWLTQFPEELKTMTRFVYLLELWGPFLFLAWGRIRMLGVFLFVAFHAGLALSLDLALFPWIAFACLFSIMPSEFWELFPQAKLHIKSYFQNTQKNISTEKIKKRNAFETTPFQKRTSPFAVAIFALAITWNIFSHIKKNLPTPIARTGQWLHVDQYWGMFAPYPLKDSGWYEFGLQLWNGEYVYTFINDSMESEWSDEKERPVNSSKYFIDQRWRKYLINLWDKGNAKFRPSLAAYLCRKWNTENEAPSEKAQVLDMEFTLYQNKEYLMPPRGPSSIDLGKYPCRD